MHEHVLQNAVKQMCVRSSQFVCTIHSSAIWHYNKPLTLDWLFYLVCGVCEDFFYNQCPKHRPNIVEDSYVDVVSDPRMHAMKTLPKSLTVKTSSIPDAGLGVFAKEKIKINTRFGPFKGEKIEFKETPEMDAAYSWKVVSSFAYKFSSVPFQRITIVASYYIKAKKRMHPFHAQNSFYKLQNNSCLYFIFRKQSNSTRKSEYCMTCTLLHEQYVSKFFYGVKNPKQEAIKAKLHANNLQKMRHSFQKLVQPKWKNVKCFPMVGLPVTDE